MWSESTYLRPINDNEQETIEMGYDMYWVAPPTDEECAAASDGRPEYFRLSIFGMAETREAMFELGILSPLFRWLPSATEFGLDNRNALWDEDGQRREYPPDSPEGRWQKAFEEVLLGDSGGAIPVYKLVSNDGWRVTPEEIARSLVTYDFVMSARGELAPPTCEPTVFDKVAQIDYWGEWIDWLHQAAFHEGFNVY